MLVTIIHEPIFRQLLNNVRLHAPYVRYCDLITLCVTSAFFSSYLVRLYRLATTPSLWKPIHIIVHRTTFYYALEPIFQRASVERRLQQRRALVKSSSSLFHDTEAVGHNFTRRWYEFHYSVFSAEREFPDYQLHSDFDLSSQPNFTVRKAP